MNTLAADPVYTIDSVIANGGTNSDLVDLNGHAPIGIACPAALTSVTGQLQTSLDGGTTWLPIYDRAGAQYTVVLAAGRYIALPPGDLTGLASIRLVVGSAEGAARTFKFACRKLG